MALAGEWCRGRGQGLLNATAHTPTAYRKFPPEAEPPRPRGWPMGDLDGGSGWSDSARKDQEDGGGKEIQQRRACAGTCIQGLRGAEARQGQDLGRCGAAAGGACSDSGSVRHLRPQRGLDSRGPRVEGGKDRLNCPRFYADASGYAWRRGPRADQGSQVGGRCSVQLSSGGAGPGEQGDGRSS